MQSIKLIIDPKFSVKELLKKKSKHSNFTITLTKNIILLINSNKYQQIFVSNYYILQINNYQNKNNTVLSINLIKN